jgi:hypothetical protein
MGNGQGEGVPDPGGPTPATPEAEAAQRLFDAVVVEQMREQGVALRRALRKQNLAVHGKVFAFLQDGRLVVKLPAARVAAMVASGEARPFRSGSRTMREWITVEPPAAPDDDAWRLLADQSRRYVDPTAR